MTITIVGLGPGDVGHLTRQAWDVLSRAHEVWLRTRRHPTVAGLPDHLVLSSFDDLYDLLDDFGAVYEAMAGQVVDLGRRPEGVVYAVPGHPLVGESSVQRILARAAGEGLAVRLVDGLSFIEPVLDLLGLDGLAGLQLADATDLAAGHHPALDPDRPALVGQLYGRRLASEVKLTLMNAYPDDHPVTLIQAAGTSGSRQAIVPLYELDRAGAMDHLTTLYVPPAPGSSGLPALQETVARLRAPDGCPWDREQTHQSLRANLLEETYEVLAALDAQDDDELVEELGDLLMQIVLHVQIATEEGAFRFGQVIAGIDAKLRRRHPHVFGQVHVRGTADVLRNWEAIKSGERAAADGGEGERSRLGGVPAILPALARAQALVDRAERTGFHQPEQEPIASMVAQDLSVLDLDHRERRIGDLLFSLCDLARHLDVDTESALRKACDRFACRYAEMEKVVRDEGQDLAEVPPAEQDVLWYETHSGRCG